MRVHRLVDRLVEYLIINVIRNRLTDVDTAAVLSFYMMTLDSTFRRSRYHLYIMYDISTNNKTPVLSQQSPSERPEIDRVLRVRNLLN